MSQSYIFNSSLHRLNLCESYKLSFSICFHYLFFECFIQYSVKIFRRNITSSDVNISKFYVMQICSLKKNCDYHICQWDYHNSNYEHNIMINYYSKNGRNTNSFKLFRVKKIYQSSSFHFQTNFTCFASYHFYYLKRKTRNLIHHMNNPYSLFRCFLINSW